MKNDFNYKWSKLFASKRYNTKDGVIKLTPEEQQELLDDSEIVVKNCSIPDVSQQRELFKSFLEKVVEEIEMNCGDLPWELQDEAKDLLKLLNCG